MLESIVSVIVGGLLSIAIVGVIMVVGALIF